MGSGNRLRSCTKLGLACLIAVVVGSAAPMAMGQDAATRPTVAQPWQVAPKRPPVDETGRRGPSLRVDRAACRLLERHRPAADVAYRPGVDVRGRPVAPADLAPDPLLGGGAALPQTLEIGITVDVAERFGIPADALFAGEVYVGTVAVTDGRVTFNGQPIGGAAADELVAICRTAVEPD